MSSTLVWCSRDLPQWLQGLGDEDGVTGKWSVKNGTLEMYHPEHERQKMVSIALENEVKERFAEPLWLAEKDQLTGSGYYRTKVLCDEKMVWLGHSPTKLSYIDRYTHREKRIIELICSVIERASHLGATREASTFLDLGANHGLYSFLAAAKGASVWGIEPQTSLSSLIPACAAVNGFNDFHIFRNLILDVDPGETIEFPELAANSHGEGGTASIQMPEGSKVPKLSVTTIPVSKIADECFPEKIIAFMKVDVEGVEIPALRSAYPLFQKHKVQHAVIEFGPESRWSRLASGGVAGNGPKDAALLLQKLRSFGYRTSIEARDMVCSRIGKQNCFIAPPHKFEIASLLNDDHLDVALSLKRELSLYLDLVHTDNILFPPHSADRLTPGKVSL